MFQEGNIFRTALIIEDDIISQKVMHSLLQKKGWDVVVTSSGEEAVKIWESQAFDVILLDLHLPQMHGIEVATKIRVLGRWQGRYTPIIGMTASDTQEEGHKCIEAGMDGFITKPVDIDTFYKTIEEVIYNHHLEKTSINIEIALENLEGDQELLKELVVDFFDESYASALIEDIKVAVKNGDFTTLYKKAHKLKGAAACIQINGIYEIAYELEKKGNKCENIGLEKLVNRLEEEYKRAKVYFTYHKWID